MLHILWTADLTILSFFLSFFISLWVTPQYVIVDIYIRLLPAQHLNPEKRNFNTKYVTLVTLDLKISPSFGRLCSVLHFAVPLDVLPVLVQTSSGACSTTSLHGLYPVPSFNAA